LIRLNCDIKVLAGCIVAKLYVVVSCVHYMVAKPYAVRYWQTTTLFVYFISKYHKIY